MEERVIKIDQLIEDLWYDIELDNRALDEIEGLDKSRREIIQFDKDCKRNCIDLLEETYRKQNMTP